MKPTQDLLLIAQYNMLMAEGKTAAAGRILTNLIQEATEDGPCTQKTGIQGLASKEDLAEALSMGRALKRELSRPEPGSKLDLKIRRHTAQVKVGGDSLFTDAPDGFKFKKDGTLILEAEEKEYFPQGKKTSSTLVQWEMLIGSSKTKRFRAKNAAEATAIARKAGAESVVRLSLNFKPLGNPIRLKEESELNKVSVKDMEDDPKTADQLEVGDVVEITGEVNFKGSTGEISRFGPKSKAFVVVKLYDGGEHSFHSSDVTEADLSHEDDDEDEENPEKFYVAFYDSDEERSWIGKITKEGGGKWHEEDYKGKSEHRWGQSYMSYLTPDDIMSWIYKDYPRGMEIEGPFMSPQDAQEHVEQNWGRLEESILAVEAGPFSYGSKTPRKGTLTAQIAANRKKADAKLGNFEIRDDKVGTAKRVKLPVAEGLTYTSYSDWKQAVLLSHPAQAEKIKFRGKMEGEKTTISAIVPGEERVYGVWEDDTFEGRVLSESAEDWRGMDAEVKPKKVIAKADEFKVEFDETTEQVDLMDGTGTVRVSMPLVIWKQLCRQ